MVPAQQPVVDHPARHRGRRSAAMPGMLHDHRHRDARILHRGKGHE